VETILYATRLELAEGGMAVHALLTVTFAALVLAILICVLIVWLLATSGMCVQFDCFHNVLCRACSALTRNGNKEVLSPFIDSAARTL